MIETTVPGWSRLYVTAGQNGRVTAALPLMMRRVGGALVLASMPFGTYGGALIGDGERGAVAAELFRRFGEMARSPRVACAELVDFSSRIATVPHNGTAPRTIEAHVLDLAPGYRSLLRRFSPSNRNKIRKAMRSGVVVRRAVSVAEFLEYHTILADCCARWRRPVRLTPGFFRELSTHDGAHVEVWLAEHDGRTVAGLLNFLHDGTVMNWGSVSLAAGRQLAVHNLLHATAIESASRRGAFVYNFGANPGLPGVAAFKASFGTRPLPYHAYRIDKLWYRLLRDRPTRAQAF